uniref:Phospholipase B1, membrane-associated n=1 Tax=Arcella intermedia TaxID=1963864 RepID=A0A6B2LAR1_9EUKA
MLPADIDIIMAMGDSLTAGFGADSTHLFNLFVDYRGSSFSVGGAKSIDECSTLANILQVYNRNITGYSTGAGEAEEKAKLNVAVTGSRSRDLLKQVHVLRDRLQAYDMKQWKMLTIFIGSNDLCGSCFDPQNSAEHFVANLELALDAVKMQIPFVFVSVIAPPDISILKLINTTWCSVLHTFECPCFFSPGIGGTHEEYVSKLQNLIDSPKYHDDPLFNVVLQPFFEDITIPLTPDGHPDMTFFAPDCFHFSTKAHSAAGLALWNNLMQKPKHKKTHWTIKDTFQCPFPGQHLQ